MNGSEPPATRPRPAFAQQLVEAAHGLAHAVRTEHVAEVHVGERLTADPEAPAGHQKRLAAHGTAPEGAPAVADGAPQVDQRDSSGSHDAPFAR